MGREQKRAAALGYGASVDQEAAGPTEMLKACMFTNSPDEHFIIDVLPDCPRVAIAAGRGRFARLAARTWLSRGPVPPLGAP